MNDRALVTLAIGQPCLDNWQRLCAAGWQAYASRHGLDLVVVTEPLVPSERPIPWQKCFVPSHPSAAKYRQIAVLDADIAINPEAPNIFDQVPPERIGGVISGSHIHDDLKLVLLSRLLKKVIPYERGLETWRADQNLAYSNYGLTPQAAGVIQTGVLVVSPQQHAGLFRAVYDAPDPETRQYEQMQLSHAILSAGLLCPIDSRFNSVLFETLLVHHHYLFTAAVGEPVTRAVVHGELANNFFLHFAYNQNLMRFLGD